MKNTLPLPGIIFDIDGVLVDSNPVHLLTWQQIGREDGFDFSPELFYQTVGQTTRAILAQYWHRPLSDEEIRQFDLRKEYLYREIAEEKLLPFPGAIDFIQRRFDEGYTLSVGSSGPGFNVDFVLEKLGIKPFLSGWVSGTDVQNGKPAPDIFLAAAKTMGLPPQRGIVIDDSLSGITAANRAGMTAVAFFSGGHHQSEYEQARLVVHSFAELEKKWDYVLELSSQKQHFVKKYLVGCTPP